MTTNVRRDDENITTDNAKWQQEDAETDDTVQCNSGDTVVFIPYCHRRENLHNVGWEPSSTCCVVPVYSYQ